MWSYFIYILVFQTFKCEEIKKIENSNVRNDTTETRTQPQLVSRSLQSSSNSSTEKAKSEFRPSPQLETYYEYNKFPVPPAQPEAKHFYNFGESPIQWPTSIVTTEQAWSPKIKFPTTTTTSPPTSKDRPYPFYYYEKSVNTGKSYTVPNFEKIPTLEEWNKFMEYERKKELVQKHQFDFMAPVPVEKPSYGGQKSGYEIGSVEKPPTHVQGNHWKKIAKFLTALVPIGLLLSALTPTVITVQSVNGTLRSDRKLESSNNKLVSSLNYFNSVGCEDRVLCELVLSASITQNAEQHVENLLNTFTEEGKAVEKAEEMRRIVDAVKKQDCRSIACKGMKDET